MLRDLEILDLRNRFPATLSQGEKQRIAIARALAPDPEFIIADEPTASLGTNQGFEVIKILSKYSSERHKSVLVASHDLRLKQFADRILTIENGEIVDIPSNRPALESLPCIKPDPLILFRGIVEAYNLLFYGAIG